MQLFQRQNAYVQAVEITDLQSRWRQSRLIMKFTVLRDRCQAKSHRFALIIKGNCFIFNQMCQPSQPASILHRNEPLSDNSRLIRSTLIRTRLENCYRGAGNVASIPGGSAAPAARGGGCSAVMRWRWEDAGDCAAIGNIRSTPHSGMNAGIGDRCLVKKNYFRSFGSSVNISRIESVCRSGK